MDGEIGKKFDNDEFVNWVGSVEPFGLGPHVYILAMLWSTSRDQGRIDLRESSVQEVTRERKKRR